MDVMVYDKHFNPNQAQAREPLLALEHCVFADLLRGIGCRLSRPANASRVGMRNARTRNRHEGTPDIDRVTSQAERRG